MQKSGILAQSQSLLARLYNHRWSFGALAGLAALGMAGAIAVVPAPSADQVVTDTVIEDLLLKTQQLPEAHQVFMREERIQRGDTLGALLTRLGIADRQADEFIRISPDTQAMHRQLAPGKLVVAQTSAEGLLQRLIFPLNTQDTALIIERKDDALSATQEALRFEKQVIVKGAEIQYSLFGATDASQIPDAIATQFAEIFSTEVDFHRDLRKGDRISVVYEMFYLRGIPARSGRILSAEFFNNGRTLSAVWFDQGGKGGYYTPDGKNLRKAFLRSPLEFSRVTSGFSMRFHPILKQWRAHQGVDYGAPTGTRVRATGDGIIEFAGKQGGYGNLVIIRHRGNHTTAYAHLNGFGPGIRKGARIAQGETLGYVGQTGWATGPHLHYEFRMAGKPVNPLSISLPSAPPLEQAQLPHFRNLVASQVSQLALARDLRAAAFD